MDYNITIEDITLAQSITNKKNDLKSSLDSKIIELEAMLDVCKQSITHCNKQIQLCIDKAREEQDDTKRLDFESKKIIFEDNKLIWNISGFITLISIDVKTIQARMYFANTEWHKRFYARQICTLMYESSKDIFELLGKDFKDLISQRIDIKPFEHELKSIRQRLNEFQDANQINLYSIRNNTAAHKDKDILKQVDIISQINWFDTIQTTVQFERIINDLGIFLQKLIKLGLKNLENSNIGKGTL